MPVKNFNIPDLQVTVDREVALNVMTQLIDQLRINRTKLRIIIPGIDEIVPTTGSLSTDIDHRTDLFQHDNLIVTYSEEEPEDNVTTTVSTYRSNEPLIFLDDILNIRLSPIHVWTEAQINFTYTGMDRNALEQINANMRRMYYRTTQSFLVEPEYRYFIPNELLLVLNELYSNIYKFDKDATDPSVGDWIYDHLSRSVKPAPTSDGKLVTLVKTERQTGIFVTIDPETKYTPEKGDDGRYSMTYTASFKYYKPSMLKLIYPILIRQQLVADYLRPNPIAYDPYLKSTFNSFADLNNYRNVVSYLGYQKAHDSAPKQFPSFDEWDIGKLKDYQLPVFSYLCKISKTDRRSLFSIYNIEDVFDFSPAIFEYMEVMGEKMLDIKKSAINLTVFYNDNRMVGTLFKYEDGVIEAKSDLDPNLIYHVVLSINMDFLNTRFDLNTFLKHGSAVIDILITLFKDLGNDKDFNLITNTDGSFSRSLLHAILKKYKTDPGTFYNERAYISATCKHKEVSK